MLELSYEKLSELEIVDTVNDRFDVSRALVNSKVRGNQRLELDQSLYSKIIK